MNTESARAHLLALPHVVETLQWGDNLVFWVGDKSLGGKMFALLNLTPQQGPIQHGVLSFAATPERFAELVEQDGIRPAPYFARIGWVALDRWSALPTPELQDLLEIAHSLTLAKLPRKTRLALDLALQSLPQGTRSLRSSP